MHLLAGYPPTVGAGADNATLKACHGAGPTTGTPGAPVGTAPNGPRAAPARTPGASASLSAAGPTPTSNASHLSQGAAFTVFRGRHVADPSDFTDDELTGYWTDVRTAAKAIEHAYRPCQLNYGTFDNAVPHVHTHITPRYPDDPAPGQPPAARCPTACSTTPPP